MGSIGFRVGSFRKSGVPYYGGGGGFRVWEFPKIRGTLFFGGALIIRILRTI